VTDTTTVVKTVDDAPLPAGSVVEDSEEAVVVEQEEADAVVMASDSEVISMKELRAASRTRRMAIMEKE
jgi:hypothetical protein